MGTGPDVVTFDLDDTICRYDRSTSEPLETAFENADVEPFFTASQFADRIPKATGDSPLDLRKKCFRLIAEETDRPPAVADRVAENYPERDPTAVSFRPGAKRALEVLSGRYRLALVSNGGPAAQRTKIETLGIGDYFEVEVSGTPENGIKPDPTPFHRAVDASGVDPEQAVHIGNSPESDVGGAQAAGIPAVWLRTDDATSAELSPEYVIDELSELHERPLPWERN